MREPLARLHVDTEDERGYSGVVVRSVTLSLSMHTSNRRAHGTGIFAVSNVVFQCGAYVGVQSHVVPEEKGVP